MGKRKYADVQYSNGKREMTVGLTLLCWNEDGIYYIYSPALDLTGYGYSELEANNSFETTLREFIEYTDHKQTIFKELERLGWTVNKKKKRALPPSMEELLEDNEVYRRLNGSAGVSETSKDLAIPL